MRLELVGSYLEQLRPMLTSSDVNEIRINADGSVVIEESGRVLRTEVLLDRTLVQYAMRAIAGDADAQIDPKLDMRLEDGSRIAILGPPVVDGYAVTIRRFPHFWSIDELVANGTVTQATAEFLVDQIRERRNIVISGSTRSGKTTIARALLNTIPTTERLILIERPSELFLNCRNERDMVEIEAHEAFTQRDALRAALRHSPDRIIIGEVRGGEAFDFIDALNTGHSGSLTTVHASSAVGALRRMISLVARGNVEMPHGSIVEDIASSVHLIVHVKRDNGARKLAEIEAVEGIEQDGRTIRTRGVEV